MDYSEFPKSTFYRQEEQKAVNDMVELEITYLKNGCGFKARCSACGKLLRYAHGCNNPGLSYAEMGAKEDFEEHIKKCPALKDERIKELVDELKSARAKYDLYKACAEDKVKSQADRIRELEQKNNERLSLLEEWETYLGEHKRVIAQQAKRIKELKAEVARLRNIINTKKR